MIEVSPPFRKFELTSEEETAALILSQETRAYIQNIQTTAMLTILGLEFTGTPEQQQGAMFQQAYAAGKIAACEELLG